MTTDTIYEVLETCLQALDEGADVESCLVRYPELADELRPILEAAIQARAVAVTDIPADVVLRGRARVLQAAAEMREQQNAAPLLPFWRRKGFFGARFYRLAVTTAAVIIFLLTGGTGLVNASNGALPGDKLYPIKRSWEGFQLVFVFDPHTKAKLENQFEQERKQEIEELYTEKRFEQVGFQGVVETQQPGMWQVSGLEVAIESETVYSRDIVPGATVQIIGETDDGIIKAKQIILLAGPGKTPTSLSPATSTPNIIQGSTPENEEKPESIRTPESGEDSSRGESNSIESTDSPNTSEKSSDENQSSYSAPATPGSGEDKSTSGGDTGGESNQNKDAESSPDDSGGSGG